MNTNRTQTNAAVDRLLEEIRRYLAAVDAFRREGCDPRWLAER
jgi:hypothetical protein